MFKVTIREVLLLVALAVVAVGWAIDHGSKTIIDAQSVRAESHAWEVRAKLLAAELDAASRIVTITPNGIEVTRPDGTVITKLID